MGQKSPMDPNNHNKSKKTWLLSHFIYKFSHQNKTLNIKAKIIKISEVLHKIECRQRSEHQIKVNINKFESH